MLELLLRGYLVYLSFVQPVIYGAQLCHSPNPDPLQVTNVTLTLIFSWLLEVADVAFLSSFIAMRWLYVCARIVLALYFAHPRFLGATQVYRKLFATLVDTYSPAIDAIVVRHVQTIGESGFMQYGAMLTTGMMRGVAAVAGIAKTLLEASASTSVPAAPLPRRMSQVRDDRGIEEGATAAFAGSSGGAVASRSAASPVYSPPPARSRPVQPPSLFEDEDNNMIVSPPAAAPLVSFTVEQEVEVENEVDDDDDASGEPRLGLGAVNRPYREPETVVNRGRFKHTYTSPFDD